MTSKQTAVQLLTKDSVTGRQLTLVFEDAAPLLPAKVAALARRIPPGWRDRAGCSDSEDPDAWFPATLADQARADAAMRTCRDCPVRRECLAAALLRREPGIWGGTREPNREQALGALCRGGTVDAVLDIALALADTAADVDGLTAAGATA
jgi:hypothetical protein